MFTCQRSLRPSIRGRTSTLRRFFVSTALILAMAGLPGCELDPDHYDVILRHGTLFDGSGGPRYQADIGIRDGYIVAIGELSGATADEELDVDGLYVAPGFLNLHGHSDLPVLARAENTLKQGITTEILYPDGGGPVRPWEELRELEEGGLAVNIGGWVGLAAAWSEVVGLEDRRPTAEETERMRGIIEEALDQGAWGVTTNLDAAPQTYATTDEIVEIFEVAAGRRAAYQSHLRSEGTEVIEALAELIEIGERADLLPLWTHAKAEGPPNWGKSVEAVRLLDEALERGIYVGGDVYPYLAGQSSLARRFVARWAADGGFDAMMDRFTDPELRSRIAEEGEALLEERVGGPQNILIRAGTYTNRYLDEVAEEMGVDAGEAMIRIVEENGEDLRMNYWFGEEEDLVRLIEHPHMAAGCDCGATEAESIHPRNYGAYPRFLGEYVRDRQLFDYEEMIRKTSGLSAVHLGVADRGFIAEGLVADLIAFDPETVTDHATFEEPKQYSEGIEYVLVNGQVALAGGELTGIQAGRVLWRTPGLPARPMSVDWAVSTRVEGALPDHGPEGGRISFAVEHPGGGNLLSTSGTLVFEGSDGVRLDAFRIGQIQATNGWAGFSGVGLLEEEGSVAEVPFLVFVDEADPTHPDRAPTVTITVLGEVVATGAVDGSVSVEIR